MIRIAYFFQMYLISILTEVDCSAGYQTKCPRQCTCNREIKCAYNQLSDTIICPEKWNVGSIAIDINLDKEKTLNDIFNNCSTSNITALMITVKGSVSKLSNYFSNQLPQLRIFVINGPGLIEELPNHLFRYTKKIEKLAIRENKIKILNELLFSSCSSLQKLYLSNNLIQSLHKKQFGKCENLKIIDLGYNKLVAINKDTFFGLKSLYKLILSHNNISFIESLAFSGLENIHTIDLSNNFILNIGVGSFFHIQTLSNLLLNDNKISAISIRGFKNLERLNLLNLKRNNLDYLDESIFSEMINLKIIELDSDRVCMIRRSDFTPLIRVDNYLSRYKSCIREVVPLSSTVVTTKKESQVNFETKSSYLKGFNDITKENNHKTNFSCVNCNITLSCQSADMWITFVAGIMTSAFIILLFVFVIYAIYTQRVIYKLKLYRTNQDAMSLMTTNTRESQLCQMQRSEYKAINLNQEVDAAL